jgi:prepilin-type N-terminal cleavage/methylation domain-containing protein
MNKRGLTLLEIIIAMLILALVMTGIANIFLAGKRHIGRARSKIQAAELGRLFVAPLQKDVRQDTWDKSTNALSVTAPTSRDCAQQPGCPPENQRKLDNITYNPTYTITDVSIGTGTTLPLRKVKVTIKWNEPQAQ